jgi:hypothetical protein
METLTFEPLISPALWLTLAVAALALLGWYGWHRPAGLPRWRWGIVLVLMGLGQALVLLILLNPTWVAPVTPPAGKPLLTILVDASGSMATADLPGGRTRYQAASRLAKECATALDQRFEVRLATFAGAVAPSGPGELEARPADGGVTDLAGAIAFSLEDRPQGQALMLFSDGIHNAGGGADRVLEAARLARARACSIYPCTFGGNAEVKDLAVEFRSPQELAFIEQKVYLTVLMKQHGFDGQTAHLSLLHGGETIARREVPLAREDVTEVHFEVSQAKAGLYRYEVKDDSLPGEVSQANNTSTLLLRVVDKPVRVLLLEGKPYWDAKFLMRTLLLDPSIEVDAVVRVGENRFHRRRLTRPGKDRTASSALHEDWEVKAGFSEFLTQGSGLSSYQILVLGRNADVFLTEPVLAQVRQWVLRDGGSLVCYRGQPTAQVSQRLGQLLPLRWIPARESRFHVNLTERGRDLRWISPGGQEPAGVVLSRLPTLATASLAEQPKPLAVVLAQAGERENPVVVYQPYGTGRVVVIEGAGMWRWAFLPPPHQQLDEVYPLLWHNLLHWLVSSADLLPGQKLALRSDKVRFRTTEPATGTLLLREDLAKGPIPTVELRSDGVAATTHTPVPMDDEPGTYRIMFGKLPEGHYQARVSGSDAGDPSGSAAFDVRNLFEEQLDLKARPDLMARIARESGGLVLDSGSASETIGRFQEHQDRSQPARVRRFPAWDRWWVLVTIFGVWCTAWAVRRHGGLI